MPSEPPDVRSLKWDETEEDDEPPLLAPSYKMKSQKGAYEAAVALNALLWGFSSLLLMLTLYLLIITPAGGGLPVWAGPLICYIGILLILATCLFAGCSRDFRAAAARGELWRKIPTWRAGGQRHADSIIAASSSNRSSKTRPRGLGEAVARRARQLLDKVDAALGPSLRRFAGYLKKGKPGAWVLALGVLSVLIMLPLAASYAADPPGFEWQRVLIGLGYAMLCYSYAVLLLCYAIAMLCCARSSGTPRQSSSHSRSSDTSSAASASCCPSCCARACAASASAAARCAVCRWATVASSSTWSRTASRCAPSRRSSSCTASPSRRRSSSRDLPWSGPERSCLACRHIILHAYHPPSLTYARRSCLACAHRPVK